MSCAAEPKVAARRAIVSVNGVVIPHAAIARETQNHPASSPPEAWKAASRALAIREMLRQEIVRLGVVAKPLADEDGRMETDEEAAMRALIESEASTPEPSESELRRFYEVNVAKFRSPAISEAAHILIVAPPGDQVARESARARAQTICDHLATRPEDFADLARDMSACTSAALGGDLGQISSGQTAPEFEAALARLSPGAHSRNPVETRYGFHVIRLGRRIEGRQMPFDMVREKIAAYLVEAVRRRASAQYVAILAGRSNIVGIDFVRPQTLM